MFLRSLLASGLAVPLLAHAQPPPGYYDPAGGLYGQPLKVALYNIINDHVVLQYGALWGAFPTTDDRADGKVWDIYSDVPGGTAPYSFTFNVDQCGTYSNEGDCYNREHSFPQNWFNDQLPMKTDLFHVYPTDGVVNGERGDRPYGRVGTPTFTSQNGTKVGPSNWIGYSGSVCEPIDAYKGDLARTYFYMMTRYMPQVPGWTSDMIAAGDLTIWATDLLLQWHANDPVSTKEIDRNNAIFGFQGNRNPFIDHPEWVVSIWGPTASIGEDDLPALRIWSGDDGLHIVGAPPDGSPIQLLDLLGRPVWTGRFSSDLLVLPALPAGAYIVRAGRQAVRIVR